MNIFINDCLLQGELLDKHLEDIEVFFGSLKQLANNCDVIANKRLEYDNKIDLNLFISYSLLQTFYRFIESKDVENYMNYKFSKIKPIYWDHGSIQDYEKQYYFVDSTQSPAVNHLINNTSLAEAFEFEAKNKMTVLALNFPDSVLSKQTVLAVLTIKVTPDKFLKISCGDSSLFLEEWIEHNINKEEFSYDKSSKSPPLDKQTCLRSKIRFTETSEKFQGRIIHLDNQTGNKFYVDNEHYGEKSHIEVFDSKGNFLGEAGLDGIIKPKETNTHNISKAKKKKFKQRKLRK